MVDIFKDSDIIEFMFCDRMINLFPWKDKLYIAVCSGEDVEIIYENDNGDFNIDKYSKRYVIEKFEEGIWVFKRALNI